MSYLALYRKWRPYRFEDIVGQDVVVHLLVNSLATQRVPHAYLFCGPRGVGKTTTARVLAMALNCHEGITPRPCGNCPSCLGIRQGRSLDVVEIDAASHRGIDEVRELRENVKYTPLESRFKVYIVDEVHMLTQEAFNALLKTLEEPPHHVVFVLATTDPKRLPETILSRCVRLVFNPIPHEVIVGQLQKIASLEEVEVEEEVFHLLARKADGSLRDAESLFEQLLSWGEKKITLSLAARVLRDVEAKNLDAFFGALKNRGFKEALLFLEQWIINGLGPEDIASSLLHYFRNLLLVKAVTYSPIFGLSKNRWEELSSSLSDVSLEGLKKILDRLRVLGGDLRRLPHARILLELALFDIIEYLGQSLEKKEGAWVSVSESQRLQDFLKEPDFWSEVLKEVKRCKISLYAFLQLAEVRFEEPSRVIITFGPDCQFHKESVERRENLELLHRVLLRVKGKECQIECILRKEAKVTPVTSVPETARGKEEEYREGKGVLLSEVVGLFSGAVVHYAPVEESKGRWEDAELEKSDEGSPEDAG